MPQLLAGRASWPGKDTTLPQGQPSHAPPAQGFGQQIGFHKQVLEMSAPCSSFGLSMKTFGHSETKSPHDAMEEVDGGVLPLLFKPEGVLIQVVVANRMVSSSMVHMLN